MSEFPPTDEQLVALDLFRKGGNLAIEAGAGTGKTSTLIMLAEDSPKRGTYVAFNKSIVVEAGTKMPESVKCSTAHSLAFRAVGRDYSHRLQGARMRSIDIARQLKLDPIFIDYGLQRKVLQPGYLAGLVMRTITNFCQSADLEPGARHVPYVDGIDMPEDDGTKRGWTNNNALRQTLAPAITAAWADLISLNGSLTYKHDHYLKLWHLSGPTIGSDYILFDEAQDANPVLRAIVDAQTHAQRVWVGDSQQQIYSFTGAVNALAQVPADQRTFLTQSFRFGHDIADEANKLLGLLEADLVLIGSDNIPSTVGRVADPKAILCRTNARAVEKVLNYQRRGGRVHLIGEGKEVVAFARAADQLSQSGWTSHPELACFQSWGEVQDYVAQDAQGGDLKLLVELVDEFGTDTIITALDKMIPEKGAELVVSTAHKAKGREWSSVLLADDFPEIGPEADEELRLLYVGVTRAALKLDISNIPLLNDEDDDDELDLLEAAL